MARPKMTKKRFVRAALAAGGIGLLTALAAAVAIKGNHVFVTKPQEYDLAMEALDPKDFAVSKADLEEGEKFLERAAGRAPAASVTGKTVLEHERDLPPPPTTAISRSRTVVRGNVKAKFPARPPNRSRLPAVAENDVDELTALMGDLGRDTGPPDDRATGPPGKLTGRGLAQTMTAAQKKLHATKASVLNHGVHLLGEHVMPHLKKPRGQTPEAVCKNYKAQIKKLPADVKERALEIGHGLLIGGGLGKRGKRAFSTAAKLAALAGTLGALFLGRNHIKSGIQSAWGKVPDHVRVAADRTATDVFDKAKGLSRDVRHGIVKVVRPDGNLADSVSNAFGDAMHTVSKASDTGRSIMRRAGRFVQDNT